MAKQKQKTDSIPLDRLFDQASRASDNCEGRTCMNCHISRQFQASDLLATAAARACVSFAREHRPEKLIVLLSLAFRAGMLYESERALTAMLKGE